MVRGEAPKDNAERLQLAYRAHEKTLYAASARLYAEVLEADPKLAGDRQAQHRYNAACAAALAAGAKTSPTLPSPIKGDEMIIGNAVKDAGRGESTNSSPINVEEKTRRSSPIAGKVTVEGAEQPRTEADRSELRNQARTWLEAELAIWAQLLGSADAQQRQAIAYTLKHWQQDTDLAAVRDASALAKLPDDERKAWKSLWAKVDALLTKARTP